MVDRDTCDQFRRWRVNRGESSSSCAGCPHAWPALYDAVYYQCVTLLLFFFFQAEDGIRDLIVTGVQTCALPIWSRCVPPRSRPSRSTKRSPLRRPYHSTPTLSRPRATWGSPWETEARRPARPTRSEEHTSELQSRSDLVCRLLLEKKKKNK